MANGGARPGAGRPKGSTGRPPGRPKGSLSPGRTYSPEGAARLRAKIDSQRLIQVLIDAATGAKMATPVQVQAATTLLRKVLPDLTATELTGKLETPNVVRAPQVQSDSEAWSDKFRPVVKPTVPMTEPKLN